MDHQPDEGNAAQKARRDFWLKIEFAAILAMLVGVLVWTLL